MDPSVVRNLGVSAGYEEVYFSALDRVIAFQTTQLHNGNDKICITVWYHNYVVNVTLPDERRGIRQIFFFDVRKFPELQKIFSEAFTQNYPMNESANMLLKCSLEPCLEKAMRRQLEILDMEEKNIQCEKKKLLDYLQRFPDECTSHSTSATQGSKKQVDIENKTLNSFHSSQSKLESELNVNSSIRSGKSSLDPINSTSHTKEIETRKSNSSQSCGFLKEAPSRNKVTRDASVDISSPHFFTTQKSYTNTPANATENCDNPHIIESPSRFKGNRCLFCFSNEMYHEEFGRAWSAKPVKDVALGRGYVVVYEDGSVAWWDPPKELQRRFSNSETPLPPVQFVSLGCNDNYFIKFVTGKMEWVAVESLQNVIRNGVIHRQFNVSKVALGANGSWVVLWAHGLIEFEGVPQDMAAVLEAENRTGTIGLRDVSLGPHEEWFIIYKDHSVQANNLPNSLHTALLKIKEDGGRLRSVVFGLDTSWYVRLWDGKTSMPS
jgi:hypothetical protein